LPKIDALCGVLCPATAQPLKGGGERRAELVLDVEIICLVKLYFIILKEEFR
jgi:hypothetical protein